MDHNYWKLKDFESNDVCQLFINAAPQIVDELLAEIEQQNETLGYAREATELLKENIDFLENRIKELGGELV